MEEKSRSTRRTVGNAAAHVKNAGEVAKGRVKSAAGRTVGNRRTQAEGKVQEIKGRAKQAGQRVKESFEK